MMDKSYVLKKRILLQNDMSTSKVVDCHQSSIEYINNSTVTVSGIVCVSVLTNILIRFLRKINDDILFTTHARCLTRFGNDILTNPLNRPG